VKNSKVGIPIAHRAMAGELAARYSTVSLNSDVVPGISESITGAIYGGQQQFAALALSWHPSDWLLHTAVPIYMAAVHIQYMDVNKLNSGGTVQAGQRFETLVVRARAAR
jgi:hypothetical protein